MITGSQLNRCSTKRQPGSVFKPFVYAAALNSGVAGGTDLVTAATVIEDEPTTFYYENRTYQPSNFRIIFWVWSRFGRRLQNR